MFDQKKYLFDEFTKVFADKKQEPIVIYGISDNTGMLLEQIADYNIVGLLDGKRNSGDIWGKQILNINDIPQYNVRTIVIVARPAVTSLIFNRIVDFCKQNNISIYDIHGADLIDKYLVQEYSCPFFSKNMEDLKNTIKEYAVITFDIFDTLLTRKVLYPRDVYEVLERKMKVKEGGVINEFATIRSNAEDELYKKGTNPTIYDIYSFMVSNYGIQEQLAQNYLEEEILIDTELLVPRETMVELFRELVRDKEVYLISDMYYTKDILTRILDAHGITGYKDLLVSCEYNISKKAGLFRIFTRDFLNNRKALHIGDNAELDGAASQIDGMSVYLIMSGYDLMASSAYCGLADKISNYDKYYLGMLVSKVFNDPFVMYDLKGKVPLDNLEDFSALFCAPLLLNYCIWLLKKAKQDGIDYMLFPSRDGYIIKKICEAVSGRNTGVKLPKSVYLYASRRASSVASVSNEEDVRHIFSLEYRGTLSERIHERFGVNVPVQYNNNYEAEEVLRRFMPNIMHRCNMERNAYLAYLNSVGISRKDRLGIVDFVAAGSVQCYLEKLIDSKDITGYYFQKRRTNNIQTEKLNVKSFLPAKADFEENSNTLRFYQFLELILSSYEPTLKCIGEDGECVFEEEDRSPELIDLVRKMHNSILKYIDEILDFYLVDENIVVSADFPDMILGMLSGSRSVMRDERISKMTLFDSYTAVSMNVFEDVK